MDALRYLLVILVAAGLSATAWGRASYDGPLALPWGIKPEEAKILLQKRMTFVKEWDGPGDEAYVTTEQLYTGHFGGLPAEKIQLKFYDRKLFYVSVVLSPLTNAPRIFDEVVAKMESVYGAPGFRTAIPELVSTHAQLASDPLISPMGKDVEDVLRAAAGGAKTAAYYRYLETLMRMGAYDPVARWFFPNQVTIQTFTLPRQAEDGTQHFENLWIFSKDDQRESWFEKKSNPPPIRDY